MVSTRGSKLREEINGNGNKQPAASAKSERKRRRPRKSSGNFSRMSAPESEGVSGQVSESEDVESHISKVATGVSELRREIKHLRTRNEELKSRLDALQEDADISIQPKRGKKGGESIESLKSRLKKLTDDVSRLQFARERDKKKIRKLQKKEIEADAADLQGMSSTGIPSIDNLGQMRELLRRFYELVTSPSLEDGEECCICCEVLDPRSGNARSLRCQHTLCAECLGKLENSLCPNCREPIGDEVEEVNFTATQQWDSLLAVAADWARIDNRGDSEEEEESFIDNDGNEQSDTNDAEADDEEPPAQAAEEDTPPERSSRSNNRALLTPPQVPQTDDDVLSASGSQDGIPDTPSTSRVAYANSPLTEKRKRMEDLAERRRLKKRY